MLRAVGCVDVVRKAAFVVENAMDSTVTSTAIGFLINTAVAVPFLFLNDIEAARAQRVEQAAAAASAAALATALGVGVSSLEQPPPPAAPESLLSFCLQCVASVPVPSGSSSLAQLLARWLETMLKLLPADAAVVATLCSVSSLNASVLDHTSADITFTSPRLVDTMCSVSVSSARVHVCVARTTLDNCDNCLRA
jgi:hypothetical protein